MKGLFFAIAILALMHLAALLGVGLWLNSTGRLSRDRVERVKAIFQVPVEEEKAAAEKIAEEARRQARVAEQMQRATGASSDRLRGDRLSNELVLATQARLQADVESLQRNLELAQLRLEERQKQLDEDRRKLEERQQRLAAQNDNQGLRKAVELYESLPAKQVKEQFLQMLQGPAASEESFQQVIGYLRTMEPRKAAAVLREFKTPEETGWAVRLMEQLRSSSARAAAQEQNG